MAIRPYYWARSIERIHIGVLDMFDDIIVRRRYFNEGALATSADVPLGEPGVGYDENGYYKMLPVPLYSHFAKDYANWVYTTQNDPQQGKSFCPSIGVRFMGFSRNLAEQPPPTKSRAIYNHKNGEYIVDMQPTAYIFRYELSIYTELFEDQCQILENIYPYYSTWRSVRLKEWLRSDINEVERDVIVNVEDPNITPSEENSLGQKRSFQTIIPLNVKGVMYKMPSTANIIETIEYTNYMNETKDRRQVTRGYRPFSSIDGPLSASVGYFGVDLNHMSPSAYGGYTYYSGYSGVNSSTYYSGYSSLEPNSASGGYSYIAAQGTYYNGHSGSDNTFYEGYSGGYSGYVPHHNYTSTGNSLDGSILIHTEEMNKWNSNSMSFGPASRASYMLPLSAGSVIAATSIRIMKEFNATSGMSFVNIDVYPVNNVSSIYNVQRVSNLDRIMYINNPINYIVQDDSIMEITFSSNNNNDTGIALAYISWLDKTS